MKVDPETKCNYPECGHSGYPDCIDVQRILRLYPRLTSYGLPGKKSDPRDIDVEAAHIAGLWSAEARHKNSNRPWKWQNSYYLKHVVERHCGLYMTNGSFICGAIAWGLKMRLPDVPDYPNPGFFLPQQDRCDKCRGTWNISTRCFRKGEGLQFLCAACATPEGEPKKSGPFLVWPEPKK
jgi:hypothetical protein